LVSQFFNQGLPSSVGGDGVRVWWLTRTRVPLGDALRNVFLDRLCGFVALLALAAGSLGLLLPMVQNTGPVWALAGVVAAGLLSLGVVFLPWRVAGPGGPAPARKPLVRPLLRLLNWLVEFRGLVLGLARSPRTLLLILGSSIVVHLLAVVLGFLIARAFAIPVTFVQCLATILPALLVAYLPLSIAGWGVREGALVLAFGLIGVPAADAFVVSVTLGLGSLLVALAGGAVWLVGGFRKLVRRPS
jgi:uncharacterized membrane protein YbhN (UPF0104 family)